jgi:hypothetical protein
MRWGSSVRFRTLKSVAGHFTAIPTIVISAWSFISVGLDSTVWHGVCLTSIVLFG